MMKRKEGRTDEKTEGSDCEGKIKRENLKSKSDCSLRISNVCRYVCVSESPALHERGNVEYHFSSIRRIETSHPSSATLKSH